MLTPDIEPSTKFLPVLERYSFAQQIQELFVVLRGLVVCVHFTFFGLIGFAVQHAKFVVLGIVQLLKFAQLLTHVLTIDLSMIRVNGRANQSLRSTYLGNFRQRDVKVQHVLEEIFECVFLRGPHVLGHDALDDAVLCEYQRLALIVTKCTANSDYYRTQLIIFVWFVKMYSVFCDIQCQTLIDTFE